jgi:hypothetical protein
VGGWAVNASIWTTTVPLLLRLKCSSGYVDGAQHVFKAHYAFAGAAAGVIVLGILAVLRTFYQF